MKMLRHFALLAVFGGLSACATTQPQDVEVNEQIAALARPGQDLSTMQLQEDGCYWWLHRNPVEDTFIPVESREGRMICARRPSGS